MFPEFLSYVNCPYVLSGNSIKILGLLYLMHTCFAGHLVTAVHPVVVI